MGGGTKYNQSSCAERDEFLTGEPFFTVANREPISGQILVCGSDGKKWFTSQKFIINRVPSGSNPRVGS